MKSVALLEDVVGADEVLDSRLNILEFVPLNKIGENQGSELRFQTWALVLNTRKGGQFLIWNKNNNSCRISRILIPCHWKNRVTSDGGPLVALWSMREQLIVLDVSTGMACSCPSPPELVRASTKLPLILSTCALGSSLDNFRLLVVYGEPCPQSRSVVTPVIFDSTTGLWRIRSRFVPERFRSPTPDMIRRHHGHCWWPGYSALAGGFLHLVFRDLHGGSLLTSNQWLRYDLEGESQWKDRGRWWVVKWSQGQVNHLMRAQYEKQARRIAVSSLSEALRDLQPPLEEGVANITLRSDGVLNYAFFTYQGCLEIAYIQDVEAGTWCAHRYQRLRDLMLKPLFKSQQPPHDGDNADANWSALPSDLVKLVAQRLCSGRDITALNMVCHNWHTSLRTDPKLYQEPVLVLWNNKNNELCFFRSDKGWSRMIRGKNFIHRAPLLVQGPLLISWDEERLYISNILRSSRVQVVAPLDIGSIVGVGCINQEKVLVILYQSRSLITPAVVNFTSSTLPQWQVGNSRMGLSYLSSVEPVWHSNPGTPYDECWYRNSENVVLLGSYAYFMLDKRVDDGLRQMVFQYNWEDDEWGFEEEVETTIHDYCSYMYQFHINSPLVQLNGRPAIVRPTLEVWFLPNTGKCISKMPQETWEKLIQVLDASCDYTYMWDEGNGRSMSPKVVVITPHQCTTSLHMLCTIRNTLVAIVVWEFVLELWDVIPLSNKEDRLWLTAKYFAICLEHNSVVTKHLLRRSWFEFLTLPWHWLRLRGGELSRFIRYPYILTRAMEI